MMKHLISKIKWKKVIKWFIIIAILVAAGSFGYQKLIARKMTNTSTEDTVTTQKVETRNIQNVLSSSGTILPLNTYDVKTLVEGEVIAADFEVGDTVEEGQVLYQVSTDNLDNEIENAQTTLDRAKKSYDKAVNNLNDAQSKYDEAQADYEEAKSELGSTDYQSPETGIIKTLFVKAGDTVQKGAQVAEIYDNSSMLLVIPFNASEADAALVGEKAKVVIDSSSETLEGKVTKVSSIEDTLSGNRLVKQVTIQVKNPGGITSATTATASIGDIYSSDQGTFNVLTDKIITSDISGKIDKVRIEEGNNIKAGDTLFSIEQESIDDQLDSYLNQITTAEASVTNAKDSVESAKEAIDDAESGLQDTIDKKTDYSITAPISGKVVSKDALAGDTINAQSALCTIYDLSAVTFEMNVDELDVMNVKEGQEVDITADAFDDTKFSGVVTNVSLQSTSNQGVTQFPVTVKISDVGNLLPGMNVTGEIIIEKAEGVIAIPSDALMRGDLVYVKDDTAAEAQGDVPAGFRAVEVTTGITDGDYIEIKSGLSGNEEVYVKRVSEAVTNMWGNGMSFGIQGVNGGNRGNFQKPSGNGNFSGGGGMPGGGNPQ